MIDEVELRGGASLKMVSAHELLQFQRKHREFTGIS